MGKKRKKVIIALIVVFLIIAVFVFLRIKENLSASSKQNISAQTVTLNSPVKGTITNKLSFTGDILAIQQANIYSRVTGNILKIYADIGDFVQTGKLLAQIDNATYIQTLKQNEGLLNQAKATLENNKVNLERTQLLFEKGLVPESELDNAKMSLKVSEAQVESVTANLNNASIQVGYCNILAPFSGYITKRLLDMGSYVSSTPQSNSNVIFVLSDVRKLKVLISVLDKDIQLLDKVERADIKTDSYPDKVFSGEIKRVSQSLDLNTRTMAVEVDIDNHNNLLKPGMFANIEFILDVHNDALLVPIQSVLKDDKGDYVYMMSADSTAQKKYIGKGLEQNNQAEILNGIGENDRIVVSGQELLKEGMKLRIAK
jgi:membrane fusion protein, multidrug efflux system